MKCLYCVVFLVRIAMFMAVHPIVANLLCWRDYQQQQQQQSTILHVANGATTLCT